MRTTFERPPINEVVVGCTFEPVSALLIPHFGAFWDLVRNDYPLCEHAQPVADESGNLAVDLQSQTPLPRVWLLSADRVRLLQLQTDRFYCNWRQSDKDNSPYSRFESVYGPYKQYLQTLATFLATQLDAQIKTRKLVVTYVNLLKQGHEWQTQVDLPRVFRHLQVPVALKGGAIEHWAHKASYALSGGPGKLTVTINPAQHKVTEQQLLRIELTAACDVDQLGDVMQDEWFELAHQSIVQGFCDLTADNVQRVHWGRLA
jgi:uncharacterized protein (TIGR04255 family)